MASKKVPKNSTNTGAWRAPLAAAEKSVRAAWVLYAAAARRCPVPFGAQAQYRPRATSKRERHVKQDGKQSAGAGGVQQAIVGFVL